MKKRSEREENWDLLRDKIIGLGESSTRKSFYPQLRKRMSELETFRKLLDKVNESIILFNADNEEIADLNSTAKELFGLNDSERKTFFLDDILPEKVLKKIRSLSSDQSAKEKTLVFEYELSPKKGEKIWVEFSIDFTLLDDSIYGSVIIRDITEKKEFTRKITEERANLNAVIENNNAFIWSLNRNLQIKAMNANFRYFHELFTGIEPEENQYIIETLPPDESIIWERRYRRVLQGESFSLVEKFILEESTRYFQLFFFPIIQGNRVQGISAWAEDITERRLNDFQLNDYKTSIEVSMDGIAFIDKRGIYTYLNEAYSRIFGYDSADELTGKMWTDLCYDNNFESFLDFMEYRKDNSGNFQGESRGRKKDGTPFYAELSINRLDDDRFVCVVKNIDFRKQAETALRESEQKFRTVFQTSPDGILLNRYTDNVFIDCNNSFTTITGYTSEEMIGEKLFESGIWKNEDDYSRFMTLLNKNGTVNNLEINFRLKNGTVHSGLFSSRLVMLSSELNIITIIRDIEELNIARKRLKQSETRFRSMIESSPLGITITKAGIIQYINRAALSLFRYKSPKDMIGHSVLEFISHENRERIKSIITQRETGIVTPADYKFNAVRSDGSLFPLSGSVARINLPEGEATISFFDDISEITKAQEQINKLSSAVTQSPASIIITDLNGNIEYVNSKFLKITGFEHDEIIGQNFAVLRAGATPWTIYKKIWDTIAEGKDWHGEFHNQKKNGDDLWQLASISPVKNDKGKITHYLAVMEDITERKKGEENLRIAKENAEKSEKLKSEFLAQMSHEIRTPVNTLLSFASLIKDEVSGCLPADLDTSFVILQRAGKRIIRTIDSILNMSEIQTGTYEPSFNDTDIYREILLSLKSEFEYIAREKGLSFALKNSVEACILSLDEYTATQIFANLIDNAIKYTPEGKVTVNVNRDSDDLLFVEVSDTGIGIDKDYIPSLFKPFTQEDQGYTRQYEGNGLGLALVKNYCAINNAEISVKSIKGKGTTFRVTFLG